MTDIDIARSVTPQPIQRIAETLGIEPGQLEPYGHDKAKLPLHLMDESAISASHLVLVTAISPTPAGEGKTTVSVGLVDGLAQRGKQATAALREPSLGPVFGIKGGAAGGGHSQVIPMEDINLHFTGDFSAIEKANNLLAAMIDNALQSKGKLDLDPRSILWKRVMDMNDRSLRNIIVSLGGKAGGVPRESGFNITAASEIMAILSMASDLKDLQRRFDAIYVGDAMDGKAVKGEAIKASAAMAILMKDAIKPNLVQTLEGNPAILHAGPFANIAQGTNSLIATKMAMSLSEWVVTEAGFGADLGAEKFFNIKCRQGSISPRVVVLVATVKALKYHGGCSLSSVTKPDVDTLTKGLPNLMHHIDSLQSFGLPVVVAINAFQSDNEAEHAVIVQACADRGIPAAISEGWAHGGAGCLDLADAVIATALETMPTPKFTYDLKDSIEDKVLKVARTIYGARDVAYSAKAVRQMRRFTELGFDRLPICTAKTQKSLSDDPKRIGRPTDFTLHVREFEVAAGAGFVIPITGNILRMPGLPAVPAAEGMSLDDNGLIHGLS
jgi:formate--tetrahydrofolate ligase